MGVCWILLRCIKIGQDELVDDQHQAVLLNVNSMYIT